MKILATAAGGEHVLAADLIDPTLDWILGINVDNPFCGPAAQPGPAQSSYWVPATEGVAGWGPTQDINTGDRDTACVPSIMPLWAGPDSSLRSLRTAIGGNAHSAREFPEVYPSVVPRSSGRPELPPLHIARSLSPSSYAEPDYSPYAGPDQPPSSSQSACPTACTTPTTLFSDSPPRGRARALTHAARGPVAGTPVAHPSPHTLPACALTTGIYDRPPARCLSCPASSCPSSSILDKSTSDSSEALPRKIPLALSDPGYYSASDHSFYCTSGPVDTGYYSSSGPADSPVGASIISASMPSMSPPPSQPPSPDSDPQQKPLRPFVQDEAGNWHRKRVREMTPDELVRFRELNRAIGRRQRARSKARMEALSRRVLALRDESVALHSTIDTLAHRVLDLKMAVLQRLASRDAATRSALGLP